MLHLLKNKTLMPTAETALKGRNEPIEISGVHYVNKSQMMPPYPENSESLIIGLGCFWGAERKFWSLEGVITTAVGYSAGFTPNPTYEEVCSGKTGHNEVVLVVYDPSVIPIEKLLKVFWEAHNPTQGMQQGNDVGTQYRSGIYFTTTDQKEAAEKTQQQYQVLIQKQHPQAEITTEILPASEFYFAEEYHQQYLAKNPNGYCGLGGLGICME